MPNSTETVCADKLINKEVAPEPDKLFGTDESILRCRKQSNKGFIYIVLERTAMRVVGRLTRAVALYLSVVLIGVIGSAEMASAASAPGVSASYNGGTIDLSQGWGTANVCAVTVTGTSCFANQNDYDAWLSSQPTVNASGVASVTSGNCSTGLKLFSQVNYGGTELVLFVQSSWINLSAYSFANVLSSYKVGACAVGMTAGPNGSGAAYPGATSPGSNVTTLGAWNARMQSVYIV